MFTDMVGYSTLSQRNETLALELLAENQRLLRTQFPLFNGREVKTTGDGFLVEFPSALDATRCAVEIQRALAGRNGTQPPERHIQVRIGIHVGDVVHREADMYGDGVNIAARIEPLATGGGICLSDSVVAQVRNKLDVGLTKLASPELKHIEVPLDVYRVVLPWQRGPVSAPKSKASSGARPDVRALLIGVSAAVVLAIGLAWLLHQRAPRQGGSSQDSGDKSIAVLPFVNMSADKSDEYLSDGISEELITALSKITGLQVKARTSSFAFKGKNEDIQKIGGQLGVSHLLEGSVAKSGNKLRVTAQLIKVSDGNHLWSDTYDREMQDIFAVRSDVAQHVALALKIRLLGADKMRLSKKPTDSVEAYNLYRQGRFYADKLAENNFKKAFEFFQQAIEKDPGFALAYSGLADTYVLAADATIAPREAFPKAKAAALKAIELDDSLAEAHASLGFVHHHYDWDWAAAEKEFRRALELDPQSAQAYCLFTQFLGLLGRFKEAEAQGRRALDIDPLSISAHLYLGWSFLAAGRKDDAIKEFSAAVDLGPSDAWIRMFLGRAFLCNGMQERAIKELETARSLHAEDPLVLAFLGHAYAVTGRREEALKILSTFEELDKHRYVSRIAPVYVYAGLGEKDKAFEWLEKAYQERSDSLAWFRFDPESKSLQNDARFGPLMRKVGFNQP